jgi:hypothetical protein
MDTVSIQMRTASAIAEGAAHCAKCAIFNCTKKECIAAKKLCHYAQQHRKICPVNSTVCRACVAAEDALIIFSAAGKQPAPFQATKLKFPKKRPMLPEPKEDWTRKVQPAAPEPAPPKKARGAAEESARALQALTAAVRTATAPEPGAPAPQQQKMPLIQVKKVYSSGEKSLTKEQKAKHAAWRAKRSLQKLARASGSDPDLQQKAKKALSAQAAAATK